MYSNLTDKQIAILEFIKSEISKKGYPPAVREICDAVNLKFYIYCSFSSK